MHGRHADESTSPSVSFFAFALTVIRLRFLRAPMIAFCRWSLCLRTTEYSTTVFA